jgi:hypothetical protein
MGNLYRSQHELLPLFKGEPPRTSTTSNLANAVAGGRTFGPILAPRRPVPTTDIEMMRLKAQIYLWSEATDFKTFAAKNEGDGSSEAVLVSLFRGLWADHADPVLAIVAKLRDLASAGCRGNGAV